jgi:hypothetical protein
VCSLSATPGMRSGMRLGMRLHGVLMLPTRQCRRRYTCFEKPICLDELVAPLKSLECMKGLWPCQAARSCVVRTAARPPSIGLQATSPRPPRPSLPGTAGTLGAAWYGCGRGEPGVLIAATSAPGLGLTPATSAPGLGQALNDRGFAFRQTTAVTMLAQARAPRRGSLASPALHLALTHSCLSVPLSVETSQRALDALASAAPGDAVQPA